MVWVDVNKFAGIALGRVVYLFLLVVWCVFDEFLGHLTFAHAQEVLQSRYTGCKLPRHSVTQLEAKQMELE